MPVAPVFVVMHFAFLKFIQTPILLFTRLVNLVLAGSVGDALHINRVMIAGVRREKRIIAVRWVDRRLLLRQERS